MGVRDDEHSPEAVARRIREAAPGLARAFQAYLERTGPGDVQSGDGVEKHARRALRLALIFNCCSGGVCPGEDA
ncbi:MAG: hypothetical protein BGO49_00320 [Planctomycetales bacterium 71-10]|nr:MAG: hypothetical protein BGO49_00320 [Planctomycetales bacterium 71-10]